MAIGIPMQNSPSSTLSLDVQLSKNGKTNSETFRQADKQGRPSRAFFFFCFRKTAISLDQASLLKLSFGSLAGQTAFHHGNLPCTRPVIGSCNH